MYDDQGVQKKELKIENRPTDITKVNDLTVAVAIDAMFCIKSSGVNDTDISFISRNNLEMSSSMRGTFSRSSSRLTRHCTILHSLIDQEEKKKVNFQTGQIKVLFTIDVNAVKSGGTRQISGIFLNARNNLEMSSSMRGTFSRSSSRLTRHCISDPFDKQASHMSLQLSTI
jgi:hypothetical protein